VSNPEKTAKRNIAAYLNTYEKEIATALKKHNESIINDKHMLHWYIEKQKTRDPHTDRNSTTFIMGKNTISNTHNKENKKKLISLLLETSNGYFDSYIALGKILTQIGRRKSKKLNVYYVIHATKIDAMSLEIEDETNKKVVHYKIANNIEEAIMLRKKLPNTNYDKVRQNYLDYI
jgi:hypothetical protein